MLKPIRRVVTGHDASGRSIILSDGPAPAHPEQDFWPGRGTTIIWSSAQTPSSNEGAAMAEAGGDMPILPMGNGTTFIVMQIPPESEVDAMTPENRVLATTPVARGLPGAFELDTSRGYGMHGTDTVDYLIILSGEISLRVDDGEVTLKPFDTVIQRGVNHGWINRGTEPALVCSAVIAAEPISRDAYKKPA